MCAERKQFLNAAAAITIAALTLCGGGHAQSDTAQTQKAQSAGGVAIATVAGGDYAVVRHKGPYTDVPDVYRWVFEQWLPTSGRAPREAPCVERYLNNPMDTAPSELLTDVHIPLA